jgi:hypothetical protein
MHFMKPAQLELATAFDEVDFGGVGYVVDERNDDNVGEVTEFCWNIKNFCCKDEPSLDSVGRRRKFKKGFREHPQEFMSVEHH